MMTLFFKPGIVHAAVTDGIGTIDAPSWMSRWVSTPGQDKGQGLFTFISVFINLATVIAGIYLVIQLIMAGYMYMSANGDPKKIDQAGLKITQSMIGLVIVAGAVTLASVIGRIAGISLFNFSF